MGETDQINKNRNRRVSSRKNVAMLIVALLLLLLAAGPAGAAGAAITLPLSTGFDVDAAGFSYVDDTFRNTSQPDYAAGSWVPAGGNGGGALQVILGNVDDNDVYGMSGGWQAQVDLSNPSDLSLSFDYKLSITADYDDLAHSQVLLSVDGVLVGDSSSNSYIDRLDGGSGSTQSTAWQTFSTTVDDLPPGMHTITVGGYSSRKLQTADITEILIDNVSVSAATAANRQVIRIGSDVAGYHGAVSGGITATDVGIDILAQGGNAYDAAAASILALTEADYTMVHFGGEVPIIFYDKATDQIRVLSGQGPAPAAATLSYFSRGIPSSTNIKNAAVPGIVLGVLTLLHDYGTMTFEEVAQPTQQLFAAHTGWKSGMAVTLQRIIDVDKNTRNNGGSRQAGIIAAREFFYSGALADEMHRQIINEAGIIRKSDLVAYGSGKWSPYEDPLSTNYRGYDIYKVGPWTQGPYLLETLNIMEGYNVQAMGHNQPDYIHTTVEALKLGLADRDTYFADPNFVYVPTASMITKEYANLRRGLIDPATASRDIRPGDPDAMQPLITDSMQMRADWEYGPLTPTHDTSTVVAADRWGNVVVATPSGWGGVRLDDSEIYYGNRLRSLNTWADHPNVVEPGKRPRITLTPTLIMKDGEPVVGLSVAGGDKQDQSAMQIITNYIDFGFAAGDAVSIPRFGTSHHTGSFSQPPPSIASLKLYDETPSSIQNDLEERGHNISTYGSSYAWPSMVILHPESGAFESAGDAAASRRAAAFTDLCSLSVSGFIFIDSNRDGDFDRNEGEVAISGINLPVFLAPAGQYQQTEMRLTDAGDGSFSFSGLPNGNYLLQVQDEFMSRKLLVYPTGERVRRINLSGCTSQRVEIGFAPAEGGVIAGQIWLDDNDNQSRDEWYDANGDILVTLNTPDSNGRVDFAQYEYVDINLDGDGDGVYEPGELRECGIPWTSLHVSEQSGASFDDQTGIMGQYLLHPLAPGTYSVAVTDYEGLQADLEALDDAGFCRSRSIPVAASLPAFLAAPPVSAQEATDICNLNEGGEISGIVIDGSSSTVLDQNFAGTCADTTANSLNQLGASPEPSGTLILVATFFALLLSYLTVIRRRRQGA